MSAWHWPQFVIAAILAFGLVSVAVKAARNPSLSSERAAGLIFVWVSYFAFYAYVLHAGDFW